MVSDIRERRHDAVRRLMRSGLLNDDAPLCGVIDLDTLRECASELQRTYRSPAPTLHAVAAKSVTLLPVLREFAELGLGCEVATAGELSLALRAGFAPEHIVFDSPAKTRSDLRRALELGVAVNADNFDELERIDALVREGASRSAVLGLRINPQTGAGEIGAMSTATRHSKFGVGLADDRERVVGAYLHRPWLNQLHVHSGSQGISLEHAAQGVRLVWELAEEINARAGERRVTHLDIGGGLPVNFADDRITPSFAEHREAIERAAPGVFSGRYALTTEFGRALTAKSGTLIGLVEYAKQTGGRRIAITHVGVQVATRTVFAPESWPLRVEVFDALGEPKSGDPAPHDIAGPACFAGDLIAQNRLLPPVEAGDAVAIPDTGGYYFSTHYSYNALPRPAVYTVGTESDGSRRWRIARRQQRVDDIVADAGLHADADAVGGLAHELAELSADVPREA
ncbi:diaminopimelate decarboxylase [Leucobacter sp. wl10]|uniref:diaminopimelate decarboxylase n=1 Tax=Leucobacter sp. wl10 TaxID=2304677 RepID=UPI000E5C0411|nr:diaminopimelate decarboxylase [Leucobacter sp. wl10]RGE22048.1 diaminopimelate decarboxylase [Leucobacter sp. wl10]